MRDISRIALVAAVLVVSVFVLIFVLENQQHVTLSFLGWATASLPVSLFFTGALIFGMAIAPIVILIGRTVGFSTKSKR
ncbi:hypothetical protein LRQ11_12605 [Pseudomonas sp. MAFF 311095]|uniref:Lipopolysaccharide assembly protein A domain-containing protein n=1 Tax=Pseudomonas petroselini TaxID=2899822 RepID=A0ABS8QZ99_9PSED|nr:hypothetical protein [Pseudomonas petroselini]MCD7040378.1 hypothetical protein [Pseudomonas petroselini]MCD7045584.1 hypothetical protein [Pseudomonas petroselini]MCD7069006.1 hypothetical protein [Pseudomonas petroselini]MCD7079645.1 hypothetical protein [Pseudomonas petroselini]